MLGRIRYDFVGRMENAINDVPTILSRLLRPEELQSHLFFNLASKAFELGHSAHATTAIKHLDLFDKVSVHICSFLVTVPSSSFEH